MDTSGDTSMYQVYALKYAERLVVAGHDPQVADRFKRVEPGVIQIA